MKMCFLCSPTPLSLRRSPFTPGGRAPLLKSCLKGVRAFNVTVVIHSQLEPQSTPFLSRTDFVAGSKIGLSSEQSISAESTVHNQIMSGREETFKEEWTVSMKEGDEANLEGVSRLHTSRVPLQSSCLSMPKKPEKRALQLYLICNGKTVPTAQTRWVAIKKAARGGLSLATLLLLAVSSHCPLCYL